MTFDTEHYVAGESRNGVQAVRADLREAVRNLKAAKEGK